MQALESEQMPPVRLTVALCTHNPRRSYLERTLEGLRLQTLNSSQWEFLLIDNGSTSGSIDEQDVAWHENGRLLLEATLGLSHARLCAMVNARADLLLFVDDDNVLLPDYLKNTLGIAKDWPQLGVWGGAIEPEFDEAPPEWTRPYWQYLAIRDVKRPRWTNQASTPDMVPYGAGFCLRREVWESYAHSVKKDPLRLALGRTGTSLASAEDVDLWHECLDLGFGAGLFPQLRLRHLIPPGRLEPAYLLRLVESNQYCLRLLSHLRCSTASSVAQAGGSVWRRLLRRLRQEIRLLGVPTFERAFRQAWGRGLERADRDAKRLLGDVSPKVKSQAHIQTDPAS